MSFTEALEILNNGFPTSKIQKANEKSLEALRIMAAKEKEDADTDRDV